MSEAEITAPIETPWTPLQLEQIAGFCTAGVSLVKAAEAAGLRWSTVKYWWQVGQKGVMPYALFAERIKRAKAMHQAACHSVVMGAAKRGDWRAAAYLLERGDVQEHRKRQAERDAPPVERTVLLYPVPMPEGALPSQLQLLPGHAFDVAADEDKEP